MQRIVIFDIGGVYFSDGTRIAIDDKPANLEPAKKLGMQTISFKNSAYLEDCLKKLALLH